MSDMISQIFRNKKVNFRKAAAYGFEKRGSLYFYKRELRDTNFYMTVSIEKNGMVAANVIDAELDEPYTLHLSDGASGSFVGGIRLQYEEMLTEISERCFEPNVFKEDMTKRIISFVREEFGDELEFLWQNASDNAIWRRADNKKWYAVLLTISRRKLGLDSDENAEIIDLRVRPDELEALIDNVKYYHGWHMNKKHWCTIILDGSVAYDEICQRIKESYSLAEKK